MRKIVSLFFVFFMLPLAAQALPLKYQEGVHYEVVADKATPKKEVREFFSFYCPHCYRFEPFMHELETSLPKGTTFAKNHVDFLRGASPEIQQMLSRALVASEKMNVEEQVVNAIFKYIHEGRSNFGSESDLLNLVSSAGVDEAKFKKAMNSFSVKGEANKMKKRQTELTATRALTGVPTVIVNGKYKVLTQGLDRDNFYDSYKDVVKYLVSLDN